MKTVDIHADDYGYSINTSKDMLECMKAGALDSISIICNTKWFEYSMEMLYPASSFSSVIVGPPQYPGRSK